MDGIVLICSTLLSRSLPVFLYAKTFKTGDGQVYSNCPVDKSVRSIKTSGYSRFPKLRSFPRGREARILRQNYDASEEITYT